MQKENKIEEEHNKIRTVDPFLDWGFKRYFGQESSKEVLIEFINSVLSGEKCVKEVFYINSELLSEDVNGRKCEIGRASCRERV